MKNTIALYLNSYNSFIHSLLLHPKRNIPISGTSSIDTLVDQFREQISRDEIGVGEEVEVEIQGGK